MKHFTVSAVAPRLIAALLTPDRVERETIYREAHLDVALIDHIDSRIAYEDFQRFTAVAAGRSGDPHLGLNAIASFFPSVLDVVSFTMLASATLVQAVETLAKYGPIIDDSVEITLRRDASVMWLVAKGARGVCSR